MIKECVYGELVSMTIKLSGEDIFHLLHKAGHVPEAFGIDFKRMEGFEPVEIYLSRYINKGTGLPESQADGSGDANAPT